MSEINYEAFMGESIATLNRILGKAALNGPPSHQGSEGSESNEAYNINDLTNLFHFLLLDKHEVKQEIRDKLTKVYSIFRSKPSGSPSSIGSTPTLAIAAPSAPSGAPVSSKT